MDEATRRFLWRLLEAIGPSGYEEEPGRVWRDEADAIGAETWTDSHGNRYARLNKGGAPRVLIAGHLDEIGFLVTHIDDKGYLSIQPVGGWDAQVIVGQRVWVRGEQGRVPGVIGQRPIHLLKEEDRSKVTKIDDVFVDIGALDRDQAEAQVAVGDPLVLAWEPWDLPNGRVVSRALDNRSGAFVALEAVRQLAALQPGTDGQPAFSAEVIAAGTVQEEIGFRGAQTAAYATEPDIGIAVDVTFATDHPSMDKDKKKLGEVTLGGGPVLARGANIHPVVFRLLRETAKDRQIPIQIEAAPRATPTDANAIQVSRGGVATALISVPNRYMHSPCEMCSYEDLTNTAKLIAQTIARVDANTDLSFP